MNMLMNTKRLAVGLAALCSLPMAAQETKTWALADTESGQSVELDKVAFLLAADDADAFSVVCNNGVVMSGVRTATFKQQSQSGIATVTANGGEPTLTMSVAGSLRLSGCANGMDINVYSADGRLELSAKATGTEASIDVARLPHGVYVLKAGGAAIKFNKK